MWIVRCHEHLERLQKQLSLPPERIALIPGSIDTKVFQPVSKQSCVAVREKFGIPRDAQVLGHVALMAGRGQQELIEAAHQVDDPNLHLIFIGRGEH